MDTATEISYATFIADNRLSMERVKIPARTDSAGDQLDKKASHWLCSITRAARYDGQGRGIPAQTFAVQYSQGSAYKAPPTLTDVLDSLRADSECADGSFEEFCSDLGLNTDSRKDYAIYEACADIRRKLISMLGRAAFRQLCDEVERL